MKKSVFSQPKVDDPDPAADRIAANEDAPLSTDDFYKLIGMRQPTSKGQIPKELGTKNGLYGRIRGSLEYVQTKYRIFDIATYVFLVLQILLSAIFIVLGSLTRIDSHLPIVILGAISTVIAGVLAVMKGQGLPNRLRQTRDGLRNVIFEAEELYWDVNAERKVWFKDIIKLREDYLRVMEDARRNHPDTWNSTVTVSNPLTFTRLLQILIFVSGYRHGYQDHARPTAFSDDGYTGLAKTLIIQATSSERWKCSFVVYQYRLCIHMLAIYMRWWLCFENIGPRELCTNVQHLPHPVSSPRSNSQSQ
jgi:hypothetical protein